jgi:hypothetical protein
MLQPDGAALPERAIRRQPRIVHIPWQTQVEVVCLSERPFAHDTHFDRDQKPRPHDQPCRKPLFCSFCDDAAKRAEARYQGWIAVLALAGDEHFVGRCLLALPCDLVRDLCRLPLPATGLVGVWFRLLRGETKRNDSVHVLDWGAWEQAVPPGFDPRPVLEANWKTPGFFREHGQAVAEMEKKQTLHIWRQATGKDART